MRHAMDVLLLLLLLLLLPFDVEETMFEEWILVRLPAMGVASSLLLGLDRRYPPPP